MPVATPPAAPRSGFVSAVALLFILGSGVLTALGLANAALFGLFAASGSVPNIEAELAADAPLWLRLVFRHYHALFLGLLALSAATLAASIGLLQRRNWARLLFIGLMGVGILLNLAYLLAILALLAMFFGMYPELPTDAADFRLVVLGFITSNVFFTLVFCAVFAWIARRLASAGIRGEFGAA